MSELIDYIKRNDFKPAEQFLEKHKHIDWFRHLTPEGQNPIHLIVQTDNVKLFDLLLKRQCPWAQVDHAGYTPLYYARQYGHPLILAKLAELYRMQNLEPDVFWGVETERSRYPKRKTLTRLFTRNRASSSAESKPHSDDLISMTEFLQEDRQSSEYAISLDDKEFPQQMPEGNLVRSRFKSLADYNADKRTSSDLYLKFCLEKQMIEISLCEAGLSAWSRLYDPGHARSHQVKKLKRMLAEVGVEERKEITSSTTKHKHRVKKKKKVDVLRAQLRDIFVHHNVRDESLMYLDAEKVNFLAISMCIMQTPEQVLHKLLQMWYEIPVQGKPLALHFIYCMMLNDFHLDYCTEKSFAAYMRVLFSVLKNETVGLRQAGNQLNQFYAQLNTFRYPDYDVTDVAPMEGRALETGVLSAIYTSRDIADDLFDYHVLMCMQIKGDIVHSAVWQQLVGGFNHLSALVSSQILSASDEDRWKDVVLQYLQVSKFLLERGEFHFSHAIYAGLSAAPVSRIKEISKFCQAYEEFRTLEYTFSANGNFANYRHQLAELKGLPYWGIIAGDLIHLDESEKNMNYMLVLGKIRQVINELQMRYQSKTIHFKTSIISNLNAPVCTVEELWERSYQIQSPMIVLELKPTAQAILHNLEMRADKHLPLELQNKRDQISSGEEAFLKLFEYLQARRRNQTFNYEQCKEIILSAMALLKSKGIHISELPFLLDLMSLNSIEHDEMDDRPRSERVRHTGEEQIKSRTPRSARSHAPGKSSSSSLTPRYQLSQTRSKTQTHLAQVSFPDIMDTKVLAQEQVETEPSFTQSSRGKTSGMGK